MATPPEAMLPPLPPKPAALSRDPSVKEQPVTAWAVPQEAESASTASETNASAQSEERPIDAHIASSEHCVQRDASGPSRAVEERLGAPPSGDAPQRRSQQELLEDRMVALEFRLKREMQKLREELLGEDASAGSVRISAAASSPEARLDSLERTLDAQMAELSAEARAKAQPERVTAQGSLPVTTAVASAAAGGEAPQEEKNVDAEGGHADVNAQDTQDNEDTLYTDKQEDLRARLACFYAVYAPERADMGLDDLVQYVEKRGIEALDAKLARKYGTTLARFEAMQAPRGVFKPEHALLLEAFYGVYNPKKITEGHVATLATWAQHYGADALGEKLQGAYGESLDVFAERYRALHVDLGRFYAAREPSKMDSLDTLTRWGLKHGRDAVNDQLVKKYGTPLEGQGPARTANERAAQGPAPAPASLPPPAGGCFAFLKKKRNSKNVKFPTKAGNMLSD